MAAATAATVAAAAWWRQLGGSLATAWHQGPHDNNINQKYSGIGHYRIKRLQGQQHDSGDGGGGGSLAAAAAVAAWWQRSVKGCMTITSIKNIQG
jgi:hypothetical protein